MPVKLSLRPVLTAFNLFCAVMNFDCLYSKAHNNVPTIEEHIHYLCKQREDCVQCGASVLNFNG